MFWPHDCTFSQPPLYPFSSTIGSPTSLVPAPVYSLDLSSHDVTAAEVMKINNATITILVLHNSKSVIHNLLSSVVDGLSLQQKALFAVLHLHHNYYANWHFHK